MKDITKIKKAIKLLNDAKFDVDFDYYEKNELKEYTTWNDFIEHAETLINESGEIIYYYNAMEYLKENDGSLRDSIDIALEFGYELKDINSELLATLLHTQNLNEQFYEIIKDLNN